MTEKKKKTLMGRLLTGFGLILKVVQIVTTAAGVREMGNTEWTAITASFLAGGLLVFALERRGKTAPFAAVCAVAVLLSMIKTQVAVLLYGIMFLMLISYALMLFTMKKKAAVCGVLTLLCTAALILCAFKVISIAALPGTVLLTAMYLIMAAGLFV